MSNQHKNLFLIIGTTVGGIFSPVCLESAGTVPFLLLVIVIGYLLVKVNFFIAKLLNRRRSVTNLFGYAQNILGLRASKIAVFLLLFSTWSYSCLSYLGGIFGGHCAYSSLTGSLVFLELQPRYFYYLAELLKRGTWYLPLLNRCSLSL